MAKGIRNQGLIGLTHQAGKREAARHDLNVLTQLHHMKKEEEREEQAAALAEQQYYENLRSEADKLLSGDRKKINEKAKSIQSEIRKNIKLFGGSRKKFLANGGLSMISDYKNQVLNSEEFQIYKENKINMERILDVKQKNLGHLLTPQDQLALENYERNGHGRITYSGLMNEIEIPDSNLFDYGTEISELDILATGSNKMKLIANYMLEFPNANPEELTTPRLLAYINAKGYGGRGSNISRLQYQRNAKGSKTATGRKTVDKTKSTISGAFQHIFSNQKQVDINNIKDDSFRLEGYIDATIGDNFTTKWDIRGEKNPTILNAIGNVIPGFEGDNGYRLRGARKLPNSLTEKLWRLQNQDNFEYDNGWVRGLTIDGNSGMFNADGEAIQDEWKAADYQIVGQAIAWETIIDGKPTLVMDAVNEENEFDEDRTKTLYRTEDGHANPTAKPVMVQMLKEHDGTYDDYVYQKIEYGDTISQAQFSELMGDTDDITDMLAENTKKTGIQNQAELTASIEKQAKVNPNIDVNHAAFDSDLFEIQSRTYNVNPTNTMRNNLRKAFYLTMQDLLNNGSMKGIEEQIKINAFDGFVDNLAMMNDLKNPQLNDASILDKMLIQMDSSNPNNILIIEKMKNYLTKLYGN